MRRLDRKTVDMILKYRRIGFSYGEIAGVCGIPKSTARYHASSVMLDGRCRDRLCRKIDDNRKAFAEKYARALPEDKVRQMKSLRARNLSLSALSKESGVSLSCVKRCLKGTSAKNKPTMPRTISESLVRVIAHCIFDGFVLTSRDYVFGYSNKSRGLVEQFIDDVSMTYGMLPHLHKDREGCYIASCYSKAVVKDLLGYTESYSTSNSMLPTRIPEKAVSDVAMKSVFLRAFWDDEGSVSLGNRSLVGVCFNDRVLAGLAKIHKDLGIECIVRTNRHEIALHRRSEILKFRDIVNFSEEALVGRGKWIGFSKRRVLDMLADSYRQ